MPLTANEIKRMIEDYRSDGEIPCFRRMNLYGADFRGTNLSGADFEHSNLREAILSWANLEGANLSRTNLEEANLSRANLEGANLREANLAGANLFRTYMKGTDFSRADLSHVRISYCTLINADFTEVDLSTTTIQNSDVTGTILDTALPDTDKLESELEGAEYFSATRWSDGFDYKAAARCGEEPENDLTVYRVCFSDGIVTYQVASTLSDAAMRAHSYRYKKSGIHFNLRETVTVVQSTGTVRDVPRPTRSTCTYSVYQQNGVQRFGYQKNGQRFVKVYRLAARTPIEAAILAHANDIKDGEDIHGSYSVRNYNTGDMFEVVIQAHLSGPLK